jgi:hypothetical protein
MELQKDTSVSEEHIASLFMDAVSRVAQSV